MIPNNAWRTVNRQRRSSSHAVGQLRPIFPAFVLNNYPCFPKLSLESACHFHFTTCGIINRKVQHKEEAHSAHLDFKKGY